MRYTSAILLAAGRGIRLKLKVPKPLVEINSRPLIIYSLLELSKNRDIRDIIVVANSKNKKNITRKIRQYKIGKIKRIVLGGRARQDSVRNGLKALDGRTELVLIHDAARPFINREIISSLIAAAHKCGAAIAGVPVRATIKKATTLQRHNVRSRFVEKTIDRSDLWEIQTPQVFRKKLVLEAYKRFSRIPVTDDAALIEKLGKKVKILQGSHFNIKITAPEDLIIAKSLAARRS